MTTSAARSATTPTARRAFTLLELLVVFTVIAVLVGVALMVGQKVTGGSKVKSTQNVLQTLDQAVDAYIQAKGGTAARFPDRFVDVSKNEFPLADGTINGDAVPSAQLAVEILKSEPSSASIIKGIQTEFIGQANAPSIAGAVPEKAGPSGNVVIVLTEVKDAWGKPIRFVHPAYQGIYGNGANPQRAISLKRGGSLNPFQVSRQWAAVTGTGDTTYQGEGDGGLCAGGRPYFYSAGPDNNPATIEDNVYSIRPTFDAAVKAGGQ